MAVDPTDFEDDLLGDGTDTLVQVDQLNTNNDEDEILNPNVENTAGEFEQDVTVDGGDADAGNGIENGGGVINAGDDASISGSTSATADAEAADFRFLCPRLRSGQRQSLIRSDLLP